MRSANETLGNGECDLIRVYAHVPWHHQYLYYYCTCPTPNFSRETYRSSISRFAVAVDTELGMVALDAWRIAIHRMIPWMHLSILNGQYFWTLGERKKVGEPPCGVRGVDEMVLVVQTVSYINYELLIEWPWQWCLVTSLMTSQRHSGFPGDNNTPSPGSSYVIVSDLAVGTVVDGVGAVSARHSK